MSLGFLYLSQEDVVAAGAANMEVCVDAIEETFSLLDKGDYIMGGADGNSHGCMLYPPKESPFPGMPLAGPDRRFMAMPAYLGGSFQMAGVKCYGSNRENVSRGLPRSILMITLMDKETGAPVSFMSGNLISSMRTGAGPGVGARHLANPDSEVVAIIGCGVIGRSCLRGILAAMPGIKQVNIYDPYAGERVAEQIKGEYPDLFNVLVCNSVEEAVWGTDIINVATSGDVTPMIEYKWLKPGALLSFPASIRLSEDLVAKSTQVADNFIMHKEWIDEGKVICNGDIYANKERFIKEVDDVAAYWQFAVDKGELKFEDIKELGAIVNGKVKGRTSHDEIIVFGQGGMPIEDVAWSTVVYHRAVEKYLGVYLPVWESYYDL